MKLGFIRQTLLIAMSLLEAFAVVAVVSLVAGICALLSYIAIGKPANHYPERADATVCCCCEYDDSIEQVTETDSFEWSEMGPGLGGDDGG